MDITETKHLLEIELQAHETAETLDRELPEFFGMLFTFDNTRERAILTSKGKRYASCGFTAKEHAEEYMRHRARSSNDGGEFRFQA